MNETKKKEEEEKKVRVVGFKGGLETDPYHDPACRLALRKCAAGRELSLDYKGSGSEWPCYG